MGTRCRNQNHQSNLGILKNRLWEVVYVYDIYCLWPFPIFWDLVRFARWDQKLALNKNPHEVPSVGHWLSGYGCPHDAP